jgi:hypothetical protein
MERGLKISISCLIEYKAKEEREGERRELLAKTTETLAWLVKLVMWQEAPRDPDQRRHTRCESGISSHLIYVL